MTKITKITYEYTLSRATDDDLADAMSREGAIGWVNGTVHLDDGSTLAAGGGGWMNEDGSVTPYRYSEAGDVDALAVALDMSNEDVVALLASDCPRRHKDGRGYNNHPNRRVVYRVSCANGRFDHVVGKRAAIARAAEISGADASTSEDVLVRDWGVTIRRVSAAEARAVGL